MLVGAFIGKTTLEKNSKNLLKSNLGTFCDLAVLLVGHTLHRNARVSTQSQGVLAALFVTGTQPNAH